MPFYKDHFIQGRRTVYLCYELQQEIGKMEKNFLVSKVCKNEMQCIKNKVFFLNVNKSAESCQFAQIY